MDMTIKLDDLICELISLNLGKRTLDTGNRINLLLTKSASVRCSLMVVTTCHGMNLGRILNI
jgi:hypothetical protein